MTMAVDEAIPTAIALITASVNKDKKALRVALGDLEATPDVINLISALTHIATKLVHSQSIVMKKDESHILQTLALHEINKREGNGDFS